MEGNARRRPSATLNTSDSAKLLQGEPEAEPNKKHAPKGSKLLERPSTQAIIAIVLLVLLVLWSFSGVLTDQPRSGIFTFLRQPARHTADGETIGILLHPEDHSARDVRVIELHWTVTAGFRAPDGVRKRVYLINGKRFDYLQFGQGRTTLQKPQFASPYSYPRPSPAGFEFVHTDFTAKDSSQARPSRLARGILSGCMSTTRSTGTKACQSTGTA
jgi:hypothetical protein